MSFVDIARVSACARRVAGAHPLPRRGQGRPIVILHGGWGYDIYPFDRQIAALAPRSPCDRPGSHRLRAVRVGLRAQEIDFHQRAAGETLAVIDALGLERPVLWGHSDGAVIALLMALSRARAAVGG